MNMPDPPEAPIAPAISLDAITLDLTAVQLVRVARDAGSFLGDGDGARALRQLHQSDAAAAVALVRGDVAEMQRAADEAHAGQYDEHSGHLTRKRSSASSPSTASS